MATVQITDVYEPKAFSQLIQEKTIRADRFIRSNIVQESPKLTEMASVGGRIGDMPAYDEIGKTEPNYSSDTAGSSSTPKGLSDDLQKWRLAAMNQSWSTMDLSRDLALADPADAITSSIAEYWRYVRQSRLVSSCLGVLADNVADDSGDMIHDIATDSADAITDAERISAEAIITAAATMGDRQNEFVALAIHSTLYTKLKTLDLIDYVVDSKADMRFSYYQEMLLIVDDGLPAVAGTNRIVYTSILFKAGVFGMGHGRVEVPSELERKPATGHGGGQTIIHDRQSYILHPWGESFISGSVAAASATYAELELAANWNRIFNRKNIGMAFLQTNG